MNITMKKDGQEIGTNESTIDIFENTANFTVSLTNLEKYKNVKKVRLVLSLGKPHESGECILYKNQIAYIVGKIINQTTVEFDITTLFLGDFTNQVQFDLKSDNNIDINTFNNEESLTPKVFVDYVVETVGNQDRYFGTIGSFGSYYINKRTGNLSVIKKIATVYKENNPFELSLIYDLSSSTNNILLGAQTSLPKGWRFNFTQYIFSDGNDYIYVDGEGIKHRFILAKNSTTVYFDSMGTGLILTISNTKKISDDDGNFIEFDSKNRISLLNKRVGRMNSKIGFVYNENTNDLLFIKDSDYTTEVKKLVSFNYDSNNIVITGTGFKPVTIAKNSSGFLNNITERGDRTFNSFCYSDGLIKMISTDNGEFLDLSYNTKGQITEVKESIVSGGSKTQISKISLEYGYFNTTITNELGVKYRYVYNEDGTIRTYYEVLDDGWGNYNVIYEVPNKKTVFVFDEDEYAEYNITQIDGNMETAQSSIVELQSLINNFTFENNNKYVLLIDYDTGYSRNSKSDSMTKVSVVDGNNLENVLASQTPDEMGAINNTMCIVFESNGSIPKIKLEHNYKKGMFKILKAHFYRFNEQTQELYMNYDVENESVIWEYDTWYSMSKLKEIRLNDQVLLDAYVTAEDLITNLKNVHKNETFNFWYNNKKGLVADVSSEQISLIFLGTNKLWKIYFDSPVEVACINTNDKEKTLTHNKFDYDSETFVRITKSLLSQGKYYNQYEYYDSNLLLTGKKDLELKVSYTYDDYGNVLVESVSPLASNALQRTIKKTYQYSDGLLISETSYLNDSGTTTSYQYDEEKQLKKITLPNGLEIDYTYNNENYNLEKISAVVMGLENKNKITYSKDKINNLLALKDGLNFSYDSRNQLSKVENGSLTLLDVTNSIGAKTTTKTVKKGLKYIQTQYDKYGNLCSEKRSADGITYDYSKRLFYSSKPVDQLNNYIIPISDTEEEFLYKKFDSKLRRINDDLISNVSKYYYNSLGNISKITNTTSYYPTEVIYSYDDKKRLTQRHVKYDSKESIDYYSYDSTKAYDEILSYVNFFVKNNTIHQLSLRHTKDSFKRINGKIYSVDSEDKFVHNYSYVTGSNCTSNLISYDFYVFAGDNGNSTDSTYYKYDNMGRITEIRNSTGTRLITYQYDLLGRIIRENNLELNKSYQWVYDSNGNIKSIYQGNYTTGSLSGSVSSNMFEYTADNSSDILSKRNGMSIIHDINGNITYYDNKSLTWEYGKLQSVSYYGTSYNYTYDSFGRRIKKNYIAPSEHNNTETTYVWDGDKIISEKLSSAGGTDIVDYLYINNELIGMSHNNYIYYFQRNIQNDIIGIYNSSGTLIARYLYNAYGVTTIKDMTSDGTGRMIAEKNHFRYRGYYYDVETGLFWCNSRYYNPEWGRWISPDSIEYLDPISINGLNVYAYCNNDPVNYFDPDGHFPWLICAAEMLFTPVGGTITQAAVSTLGYVAAASWALGDLVFNGGKGAWADMCSINWNPFNADEDKVMNSKYLSFYKGVPVLQISGMGGSMSLGLIFFDKSQKIEVLKHERGHNNQLMSMGLGNYLIQIGIPSVWKNGDETPWELSASMLGGSSLANGYSEKQKREAYNYYIRACFPIINIYNIFKYIFY